MAPPGGALAARPAIATKRWAWGGGAAAALVFALAWLRPAEPPPRPLPPELRDEPDVFMEAPVITQFGDNGAIRYRLAAAEIHQFESERVARIAAPALTLHPSAGGPPWHVTSQVGELREWATSDLPNHGANLPRTPPRAQEEELLLRDDVALRRDFADGRFVTLKTSELRVYPERQVAGTDRPVIIETAAGRTTAAGFEGDLERGWMRLVSTPAQRVHVVALPNRSSR